MNDNEVPPRPPSQVLWPYHVHSADTVMGQNLSLRTRFQPGPRSGDGIATACGGNVRLHDVGVVTSLSNIRWRTSVAPGISTKHSDAPSSTIGGNRLEAMPCRGQMELMSKAGIL